MARPNVDPRLACWDNIKGRLTALCDLKGGDSEVDHISSAWSQRFRKPTLSLVIQPVSNVLV
jgi:hypothetical protein